MFNPPALRGARTDINIPTRTLIAQSCFGRVKFSGFRCTKTSVNKRLLYNMYSLFYAVEFSEITIGFLFRTQFACKGTTFF